MTITNVRIHLQNEERLKAFAEITLDDCFVVRNIRIVESPKTNQLMVCMPSRQSKDGVFHDIAHPINTEFRAQIEQAVFDAFKTEVSSLAQIAK